MDIVTFSGTPYVLPAELARARGVTAHTVRNAIRSGRLAAVEMADRWLIPVADAQAWEPGTRGGSRPGSGRPRKVRGEEGTAA